jgi:exopolysaccharide biosynthesis predicted pyruvyltransferase EpsI/nitroreductase
MNKRRIVWIGLFPPQVPSVGDHAQIVATQKWFEDYFPDWKVIRFYRHEIEDWDRLLKTVEKDDLIFIHSSGDFGTLFYWTGEEKHPWHKTRRKIISSFPNNKIIQLPVTVFYHNTGAGRGVLQEDQQFYGDRKNVVLMCREPKSHEILANNLECKSLFVPDFVFYLKPVLTKRERKGALLVLRKDHESRFSQESRLLRFRSLKRLKILRVILKFPKIKSFLRKLLDISRKFLTARNADKTGWTFRTMIEKVIPNVTVKDVQIAQHPITDDVRESCINTVLDYYQNFKIVVTDRLHGMIFSVITKTPCIAIDDKIPHKLSAYKKLLSRSVKFVSNIEEIPDAIREVLSEPYQETELTSYFTNLNEKIFDIFNGMEKLDTTKRGSEYRVNPDDLMELIKGRRSTRKWLDRPVEEEKIKKILTAGIYAPTACNYQATRFYVVRDKMLIEEICKNSAPWFKNNHPNRIILVLFDVEKPHPLGFNFKKQRFKKRHPWSRFIWQDTAVAMMNMMLMAEALGLRTCWQSVEPKTLGNKEENIRRLLKISPRYILTCLLFLGYGKQKVDISTHKHYGLPIRRDEKEFVLESKP